MSLRAYSEGMVKLRAFQVAANEDGFIEVNGVEDGSAVWLRNRLPDLRTNSHKRLCLDGLTNSATIYWQAGGGQCDSKTFRTVASFQEWLGSHPHS
jgi:hypothetical protein